MAGIFVPTLILPLLLTVFIVVRMVLQVPVPIEQATDLSHGRCALALGLWNMLWLCLNPRIHQPIGVHGAVLPFLLLPSGTLVAHCLGILALGIHGVTWFQTIYIPYA